jgi:Flp pilus assembly protein TadB
MKYINWCATKNKIKQTKNKTNNNNKNNKQTKNKNKQKTKNKQKAKTNKQAKTHKNPQNTWNNQLMYFMFIFSTLILSVKYVLWTLVDKLLKYEYKYISPW